jgi:ketosteroid isomerase-like protein
MSEVACTNAETVERFLDLLTTNDVDSAVALFATDATVAAPFAPPPLPPSIEGATSISAMFHMIMDGYARVAYVNRRIAVAEDADLVVARWRTDIDVATSGKHYDSEVVALFEFGDGRITRYTEYFNPDALRAAGIV